MNKRLIEDYLKEADDFRTVKQIMEVTHECYKRVAAALQVVESDELLGSPGGSWN